jgi:phosphatidylinositol-3-phosphatase
VNAPTCSECGAALAPDQRYCVSCGERLASARPPFAAPGQELPSGGRASTARTPGGMPPPRSAAILVLGVVGLGLLIGGLGSSGSTSLANSGTPPIILASAPQQPAPAPTAAPTEDAGSAAAPETTSSDTTPAPTPTPSQTTSTTSSTTPPPSSDQQPSDNTTTPTDQFTLPAVRHVFVIVLSGQGYTAAFGPSSQATYLTKTLVPKGELLEHYYATGHADLPNYIALISGQAGNPQTDFDCQTYADLTPGTVDSEGQAEGEGCVYPAAVQTIGDELQVNGFSWKSYMGDIGSGPPGTPTTCRHPAIGAPDDTYKARPGDQYATRHNPFVYFHSIIDSPDCSTEDVGLDQLEADLAAADSTPNYSFIAPNLCDSGTESPCVDGSPGGLVKSDAFLKEWVPKILASPAYKADGLLAIVFDQGAPNDVRSCCGETDNQGGGRAGALLLSQFVKAGTVNKTTYNNYSLLASIEDLFALGRLGGANTTDLPVFDRHTYTATATTARVSQVRHRLFTKRGFRAGDDGHHRTTRGG